MNLLNTPGAGSSGLFRPARVWGLEGVRNFRDFGGYPANNGRVLRRGRLFRSAQFSQASGKDLGRLNRLEAGVLVDLRRPEERRAAPDAWPCAPCSTRIVSNESGERTAPPHMETFLRTDLSPAHVIAHMCQSYADLPYEPRYVTLYRDFLRALVEGEAPVVVHCTHGKDRTGVICAITLRLLGVPRRAVFADYDLSNRSIDWTRTLRKMKTEMESDLKKPIPAAALRPFLGVRKDYLDSAFAAIKRRSGSFKGYAREVLNVDDDVTKALRERLTA